MFLNAIHHYWRLSCVVLYLLSTHASAGQPTATRQQELQIILKQDCGACHGLTLQGGLGPALTAAALKNTSDSAIAMTIREGRKNTAMPPWKPFISMDEAYWLTNYLRKQP